MLNKVILMGRLTSDPEHKVTPSGASVTSFSIAVERNFVDKSTGKRGVDFINIVAWRGTADLICKYFSKGRLILIEGSMQVRNYEDKTGNKRTATEVIAENVSFCGDSGNKGGESRGSNSSDTKFPVPDEFNEPAKGKNFSVGDFSSEFEEFDTDDSDLPY